MSGETLGEALARLRADIAAEPDAVYLAAALDQVEADLTGRRDAALGLMADCFGCRQVGPEHCPKHAGRNRTGVAL